MLTPTEPKHYISAELVGSLVVNVERRITITLISCYAGNLPNYFPFWARSVAGNPSIRVLLIVDRVPAFSLPENCDYVIIPLAELAARVQRAASLDRPVALHRGFKICDVRPLLGVALEDHLRGQEFWGWLDLDVVLGDLRRSLARFDLARIDVLSTRERHTAGGLTLVRNASRTNSLFRDSADLEQVLTDPRSFGFDECGVFSDRSIDGFTQCVRRAARHGKIRACFAELMRTDGKAEHDHSYLWSGGTLTDMDSGAHVLMYHFKDKKALSTFAVGVTDGEHFVVDANGIRSLFTAPTVTGNLLLRWRDRVRFEFRLLRSRLVTRGFGVSDRSSDERGQ